MSHRRLSVLALIPLIACAGAAPAQAVDQITIPENAWPRIDDRPGSANDRIILTRVPGVQWVRDEVVVFPDGADTVSLPATRHEAGDDPEWAQTNNDRVFAYSPDGARIVAPGALTTMDGRPQWWLRTFRGARATTATSKVDVTSYPRTLSPTGAAMVSFDAFPGARGKVTGWVQYRRVDAGAGGRRAGGWINSPTLPFSLAGEAHPFSGTSGATYELRVKASDLEDRTQESQVTEWSAPTPFGMPCDVAGGVSTGDMKRVRQPGAFGGTVMRSATKGGSWTSSTFYGTELALAFSTGKKGSRADVLVDGKKLAMVNTYSAASQQRQVRYLARNLAPGRAHRVKVVNAPRTVTQKQLELDAMVVTSTR